MSATERRVGKILDDLGVTLELRDSDRVTDVLVLAKVIDLEDEDAAPALAIGTNETADWISSRGLFDVAGDVITSDPARRDPDA